jgi:putative ABC transport system permease protein
MGSIGQDLRWCLRGMGRNRGLTLVIVLSLALAIGANTAVFSIVNAFLLRPLPIEDIDRVVRVRENLAKPGDEPFLRSVTAATYFFLRENSRIFAGVAAATGSDRTLTGMGLPERVSAARVTASFFPVLGIQPILGRNIQPQEDRPGTEGVVLLSHGFWTSHFAADRGVLARTLTLDGRPYRVIGVMPRGLRHPYEADLWVPLALANDPRSTQRYYVPARIKPGIPLETARAEVNGAVRRLREQSPSPDTPWGADLSPLRKEMISDLDRNLFLLTAAAGFVLLIACVNISNLLLAQSLQQSVEVAVRVALGASRKHLLRQFLTYGVVLSLCGGLGGLLLTFWSIRPLVALSPVYGLGEFDIQPRPDLTTLGFSLLLSVVVGTFLGLIPALRVSTGRLQSTLRTAGRGRSLSASGRRLLGTFVVAQVALALVLVVSASLVLYSFTRLVNEPRGFDLHDRLTFEVAFSNLRYPEPGQRVAFLRRATERLRDLPGVVAVGATSTEPLYPGTYTLGFNVEGRPAPDSRGFHVVHTRTITPDYIQAMGMPLLEGRLLTEHDTATSQPVVLISKSMADRYWPHESALGKRVKEGVYDSTSPWMTIVGVVGTLKETEDEVVHNSDAWYIPYTQAPPVETMVLVLRTRSDPRALIPEVRNTIAGIDREEAVYEVSTMEERLARRTMHDRFSAILYTLLGGLGLGLAALGIYGVLSFTVSQRTREIGIRSAMGAQPRDVKRLILRDALLLIGAGLLLGAIAALGATKLLVNQFYGVQSEHPWLLGPAALGLAAVALLSSYIPALRAARVDPILALRQD